MSIDVSKVRQKILEIIGENGAYQSDLVRATGFSKSRVSEVLSILERENVIRRTRIGRSFKVELNSVKKRGSKITVGFTRAAEYLFLIPFYKRMSNSYSVRFKLYNNGIDVMRDMLLSRIDIAVAPLVTQFIFYSIGSPVKIIAPAGSGGASIVSPKNEAQRIASTKLSTMELMMRSALNSCIIQSLKEHVYSSSPEEMVNMLSKGRVDGACIWEPYATLLEKRGFRKIVRYSDINEHVCCVLSMRADTSYEMISNVHDAVLESINLSNSTPESYISQYSVLTGYEHSLLEESIKEYTYPEEIDSKLIIRQLNQAGITVPEPNSIQESIFRK